MTGYALCGSFCTVSRSLECMRALVAGGADIQPIMSDAVYHTDTRFFAAEKLRDEVEALCGRKIIHTIAAAEPLGPKAPLDLLIIAPCTGNTLAKMAAGITDTPVTMAAKAHLRSDRPLVVALASNDALSSNLKNIGAMLMRKSVYFVPMSEDDPENKPHSLVAHFDLLDETVARAKEGRQIAGLFR